MPRVGNGGREEEANDRTKRESFLNGLFNGEYSFNLPSNERNVNGEISWNFYNHSSSVCTPRQSETLMSGFDRVNCNGFARFRGVSSHTSIDFFFFFSPDFLMLIAWVPFKVISFSPRAMSSACLRNILGAQLHNKVNKLLRGEETRWKVWGKTTTSRLAVRK